MVNLLPNFINSNLHVHKTMIIIYIVFQTNAVSLSLVEIINGINGTNAQQQMQCTQAARKLLSKERNPPIDDIISAGVIPRMVEYLSHNDRYKYGIFVIYNVPILTKLGVLQSGLPDLYRELVGHWISCKVSLCWLLYSYKMTNF